MKQTVETIDVYLEIGKKRTFACAVDWPGWCRSGRDETAALQALGDYGPRYARIPDVARIVFAIPVDPSSFVVTERLAGNATTDFGAPGIVPLGDAGRVGDVEFQWLQALLKACWQAFDETVQRAAGIELRKGPRGGGRDLDRIIRHVLDADAAYLPRLAWRFKRDEGADSSAELNRTRAAILDALTAAAHDELPESGPRGGAIWPQRYFVRRVAWHVLDHAWEIEDRIS